LKMAWRSALERYPEYSRAIGMISIEIGNLEVQLSELLAAILTIPNDLGQAIYLTPKAAIARLDVLSRVTGIVFDPSRNQPDIDELIRAKENDRMRVEGLIGRSRSVIGKRHHLIHESWGISEIGFEVSRQPLPMRSLFETGKPVPLAELTDLISRIRTLIDEVNALTMELVLRHAGRQEPLYKIF
jgi:hypothetical protein